MLVYSRQGTLVTRTIDAFDTISEFSASATYGTQNTYLYG